ncbi:helix-turn-helix transcriptional regulator [Kribbella sandramycini]|uniref:AraC-like DNA-binding protein n=1 Tax=Kribbella sandramycini TaxID=60450 RepID=A0A7Y4KVM1_9ACTN|nr:AraC family transcriptional regulator [Kribbella sandramycini]MBB6568022.1 AraC-like DNA-binding protein [Kribbella sandramycini]NOL39384.1 helix-turn-helix transcriptional regulator [Kribbella sandramycini]
MTLADVADADRFVDLAGLLESCEVDGFRADFLSWGHYRPEYWRNYWHTHSFHEVCLAYSGAGRFDNGSTRYDVRPGSVFLARPGDVHEIESSHSEPLGIAFWGFTFRPVGLASGIGREEERGGMPGVAHGGAAGRPAAGSDEPGWWSGLTRRDGPVVSGRSGALPALITALAAEAAAPVSGYATTLRALGATLVVETARAFALDDDLAVEPVRRDRGLLVVEAMQRHLRDNLSRPITVRDVAAVVHLSERHAERLFTQQTGASIMSTLRRLRLELAAQLLLDYGVTITEVARHCGYSDVRPFSTAFKRHYGRTPGEHRRSGGTEFV